MLFHAINGVRIMIIDFWPAATRHNKALLYAMETGLVAVFLVHVATAVKNWATNRAARPVAYAKKEWAGDEA